MARQDRGRAEGLVKQDLRPNPASQSMTPSEVARQLSEILIVPITWMHWQLLHYLCAFQAVLFQPFQEQCHTPHRRRAMPRHHTSPSASQQKSPRSFGGYTGHSQAFLNFHPLLVYSLRTEPACRVWKVQVFLKVSLPNTFLDWQWDVHKPNRGLNTWESHLFHEHTPELGNKPAFLLSPQNREFQLCYV